MSKKILLVDDDPGLHLIIVPILSKAGYFVISAKNGEQALHLALDERPDLIILDVIMPGIKGRDLCRKIKAYEKIKDIRGPKNKIVDVEYLVSPHPEFIKSVKAANRRQADDKLKIAAPMIATQ